MAIIRLAHIKERHSL
jgi:4-oxalocrotonate tautomerase